MANSREIAEAFMRESDAQTGMHDISVRYSGENPERAYKIIGVNNTKLVDEDGTIGTMPTGEFIGGVIYSLADTGQLNPVEWMPSRVLDVCMHVGNLLGVRAENQRLMLSAGKAAVGTAQGQMIPAQDWVLQEQLSS